MGDFGVGRVFLGIATFTTGSEQKGDAEDEITERIHGRGIFQAMDRAGRPRFARCEWMAGGKILQGGGV